ncbi:MAG: Aerobic carbon monoxide dehydrogenase (quinone), large chain, partial [uncultured Solirubrobacteraceae bacterium]
AGHGPPRAAAQELHPEGGVPRRGGLRHRLRLGRLRRGAGQAHDPPGPRGVRARARRAGGQGHRPRDRVLHLHGDLRPGALPGDGPRRLRPADGALGVGHRARHGDGQRHGLHGDLAARPGPRDDDGAGRGRQARGGSPAGRDPPRRHRHGRHGPGHVRLAHHRGGDGVRGPRRGRRGPQVEGDRGPRARGGARGHRAAGRALHRGGLPGQGHDPRGDLRDGARAARAPARGHEPRPGRDVVLRPEQLRVPLRRARLRGRRGARHRQGQGRPLRGGGRLRARHQPDAHRRPGPRRHRPGHRPGAVRAHRVRRGGPAHHGHLRRLRAADRGGDADVRDGPHGDALPGQLARGQGHRRGGHHRGQPGGDERRHRRAAPPRRLVPEHAADLRAGLAGDRGGQVV